MVFMNSVKLAISIVATTAPAVFAQQQRTPATHEFFYVGGGYKGDLMAGQMYVEVLRPARVTRKYPLVFIHGASQTATNWIETPDGRPGWADYFLGLGYLVYLVGQPARGRSAWHPSINGPLQIFSAAEV